MSVWISFVLGSVTSISVLRYAGLVQKFKTIFPLEASTLVYYLPGNNDVGWVLDRACHLGLD